VYIISEEADSWSQRCIDRQAWGKRATGGAKTSPLPLYNSNNNNTDRPPISRTVETVIAKYCTVIGLKLLVVTFTYASGEEGVLHIISTAPIWRLCVMISHLFHVFSTTRDDNCTYCSSYYSYRDGAAANGWHNYTDRFVKVYSLAVFCLIEYCT